MKKFLLAAFQLLLGSGLFAQGTTVNPRPITMAEYEKAKTYVVKDMDTETYVKFDNNYILDRYELRKPYFVTGEDLLKKRIDLYKLIAKEGKQELGLMIFYTNEKGKLYQACLPNFTADAEVWKKYFEDIHAIDKEEKNFVLKLSYVLSKEVGYQMYKSINQGKDISKESLTYGNDICFPGDQEVTMKDGSVKPLAEINRGEEIMTFDPILQKSIVSKVEELTVHEAKNYAIVKLTLVSATQEITSAGHEVTLLQREIEATPNHPVKTASGEKEIRDVKEGEEILCFDSRTHQYRPYVMLLKSEFGGGVQKVYNVVTRQGETLLLNGVVMRQK
jgi:hypothetical protein